MDYSHVKPSIRHLVEQSVSVRIKLIMGQVWIDFPQARDVISIVQRMLSVPRQVQTPSIMVVGESGMGKTTLINRIMFEQKKQTGCLNLLNIDATGMFSNKQFSESISRILGMPEERQKRLLMSQDATRLVQLRGYKGLLVDNLHDLLLGPPIEQRKNMGLLRELTNEPFCFTIVAFGTPSTEGLMINDSQLKKRFLVKNLNIWSKGDALDSFLKSLEDNLPLKEPSQLWGADKVKCILARTNGTTKEIVSAVKQAAVYAITSGRESISLDDLVAGAEHPFEQAHWDV